jgi:hypothetical protein
MAQGSVFGPQYQPRHLLSTGLGRDDAELTFPVLSGAFWRPKAALNRLSTAQFFDNIFIVSELSWSDQAG